MTALCGGVPKVEGPEVTRGGKSESVKRGEGETLSEGRRCKGEELGRLTTRCAVSEFREGMP